MAPLRATAAAAALLSASATYVLQFPLTRRAAPRAPLPRHLQDEAPIYGDFKRLAYFYADVYVGTPAQRFSVITDTGSNLMAVPCFNCADCGTHMNPKYQPSHSSTAAVLTCEAGCPGATSCNSNSGNCQYTQSYAEGSSIRGTLYNDVVYVGAEEAAASTAQSAYGIPFTFGCQQHEGGLFLTQEADGIMGLGQGDMSMTRKLWLSGKLQHNMFSLCLSFTGGALTLGAVDPRLHRTAVQWARLQLTSFYVVNVEGFDVEGTSALAGDFNSPHTILDSGTTFTYIPHEAYNKMKTAISSWCSNVAGRCLGTRATVSGEPSGACYRLSRPEDIHTFPSVTMTLTGAGSGGASTPVLLRVAPEHVFVDMGWDGGAYCLAIYDNGARGAVIGANAMMGNDVIFDMAGVDGSGPRAGFAGSDCTVPAGPPVQPSASASPPPPPSSPPSPTTSASEAAGPPSVVPTPSSGATVSPVVQASASPSVTASPATSPNNDTDVQEPVVVPTLTYESLSGSQQTLLAGGVVFSSIIFCALCYFCANCEVSVGRLTFRLGAGKQGRYAQVAEAEEGAGGAEEEEAEEDWGDGATPVTVAAAARSAGGKARGGRKPAPPPRAGAAPAGAPKPTGEVSIDDFEIDSDEDGEGGVELTAVRVVGPNSSSVL